MAMQRARLYAEQKIGTPIVPRKLGQPFSFGIHSTVLSGREVPVRESVLWARPFAKLLGFEARRPKGSAGLLAVAPLSGQKSAILRDLIVGLLPASDVYLLDWTDAREVAAREGPFGIEQNIAYIVEAIKQLGTRIHLLGLCQSAAPLLAAVSILAAEQARWQPLSLILIAGLLDSRIAPSRIERLAHAVPLSWFELYEVTTIPTAYPGAGRRVHPGHLQRLGLSAYLARHIGNRLELFRKLSNDDGDSALKRPFLEAYFSVVDLPAEIFLDTIRLVLAGQALATGELTYRGQPLRLEAICRSALMTIEGEWDDVSPPGQTYAAHRLCASVPPALRQHILARGVGHYASFHGQAWRNVIAPQLHQFMRMAEERA